MATKAKPNNYIYVEPLLIKVRERLLIAQCLCAKSYSYFSFSAKINIVILHSNACDLWVSAAILLNTKLLFDETKIELNFTEMEVAMVLDDLISNVVNNEQKVFILEASDEEIIEEIEVSDEEIIEEIDEKNVHAKHTEKYYW